MAKKIFKNTDIINQDIDSVVRMNLYSRLDFFCCGIHRLILGRVHSMPFSDIVKYLKDELMPGRLNLATVNLSEKDDDSEAAYEQALLKLKFKRLVKWRNSETGNLVALYGKYVE